MEKKNLRILFIGNSHTYYNDMPLLAERELEQAGCTCEVTMLAHPNWYLAQHAEEAEARFNILFGRYDYVILQEYAHPFGPEEKFFDAVRALAALIREAGSTPVIYMPWARKNEPEAQPRMTAAHRKIAEEAGALLVPVGEEWWGYRESRPGLEMYAEDGAHASPAGSRFAAAMIAGVITRDLQRPREKGDAS